MRKTNPSLRKVAALLSMLLQHEQDIDEMIPLREEKDIVGPRVSTAAEFWSARRSKIPAREGAVPTAGVAALLL